VWQGLAGLRHCLGRRRQEGPALRRGPRCRIMPPAAGPWCSARAKYPWPPPSGSCIASWPRLLPAPSRMWH